MKILVFCSDLIPVGGLPTSGGGLRSWQLIETCRRLGHEVIVSVPLFTYLARRFGAEIEGTLRQDSWTTENQDLLVERHRPDAILFCSSWIVDRLGKRPDCLLLYDLSGAQLLEMAYKAHLDHAAFGVKIAKLARADFVFCGGAIQRSYFLPFLLLAGYDPRTTELPVIPLAFEERPITRSAPERLELLAGGGFYPWQDPDIGLLTAARFASEQPNGHVRLRVFGSSHNIHETDRQDYEALRGSLTQMPNVDLEDFVAHEEWTKLIAGSSLAIDLQARNLERELAVTSRTLDYLWGGLPVLYNDFAELAAVIREWDAGWTIDPTDADAIRNILNDVISDPTILESKGANAYRLARERFELSKVWGPLATFLAKPVSAPPRQPAAILGSAEYHALLGIEAQWRDAHRSRAFQAARALRKLTRFWKRKGDSLA